MGGCLSCLMPVPPRGTLPRRSALLHDPHIIGVPYQIGHDRFRGEAWSGKACTHLQAAETQLTALVAVGISPKTRANREHLPAAQCDRRCQVPGSRYTTTGALAPECLLPAVNLFAVNPTMLCHYGLQLQTKISARFLTWLAQCAGRLFQSTLVERNRQRCGYASTADVATGLLLLAGLHSVFLVAFQGVLWLMNCLTAAISLCGKFTRQVLWRTPWKASSCLRQRSICICCTPTPARCQTFTSSPLRGTSCPSCLQRSPARISQAHSLTRGN